jgi:hypothetical protein
VGWDFASFWVPGVTVVINGTQVFTDSRDYGFIGFTSTIPITSLEIHNTGFPIVRQFSYRVAPTIPVTIDIKPGTSRNTINLSSNGTVPVAILSTPGFDARTIDPTSITLANAPVSLRPNGTPMASFEDVNGDGWLDLVVNVVANALRLSSTDVSAELRGSTYAGLGIRGTDSVSIIR